MEASISLSTATATLNSSEADAIIEQAAAGIAKLSINGIFISTNQSFSDMLGYQAEELIGQTFRQVILDEEIAKFEHLFAELVNKKLKHIKIQSRYLSKNYQVKWVFLSATLIETNAATPYVLFIAQDISDQKQQELQDELATMAFAQNGDGIIITDTDNTILQANPAFYRISGYKESEIIGRKPFLFRSGEHDESFYNRIWKALEIDGYWQGEVSYRHRNGRLFYVWEAITAVTDEQNNIIYYVSNLADMTELKQRQQRLNDLANYDALTRLPNRHYFEANLHQAVEMSKRRDNRVALLFIDLDKFKPINDKYGHKAGDEILKRTAKRLSRSVRLEDTAARIGGDEFVLLMPKIAERNVVEIIARRLRNSLEQPININDSTEVSVSASIGITIYPDDVKNIGEQYSYLDFEKDIEILELADQAMYTAKEHQLPLCFFDQIEEFEQLETTS